MTGKHYIEMARAIKSTVEKHNLTRENIWEKNRPLFDVLQQLMCLFRYDNELFNRNKFYDAIFS
jgi:hypothetical protein